MWSFVWSVLKLCVVVMHQLTNSQNTIQLSHRQPHQLILLIYAFLLISLLLLLNVTMEDLYLCWPSAKLAPFHFLEDQGAIILKEHWSECTNLLFSEISQFSNFSFLHFCLRLQLEAWPARPSSARRPSRRSGPTCCCSWGTRIMRKRTTIRMIKMKSVIYRLRAGQPFDWGEVCVERKEHRWHQTLLASDTVTRKSGQNISLSGAGLLWICSSDWWHTSWEPQRQGGIAR